MRLRDKRITQASGLAVSERWPNQAIVCNDDPGPIFRVDINSGSTRGTFRIGPIDQTEALDLDGQGVLYIASIGDNNANRHDCAIYALAEPGPGDQGVIPTRRIPVIYPDRPHNAEAMIIDWATGEPLIFTKERRGRLYRVCNDGRTRLIATGLPKNITDATLTRSRRYVLLRLKKRRKIVVLEFGSWRGIGKIRAPQMLQPESIAVTVDGATALCGSEGKNSPLKRVPIPPEWR